MKINATLTSCALKSVMFLSVLLFFQNATAQLTVAPEPSALNWANTLAGPGVSVFNATLSSGNVDQTGTFDGVNSNIGLSHGVMLSSGSVFDAPGPNNHSGTTTSWMTPGDIELGGLLGGTTHDAALLEFDMIPNGDFVQIEYVFASEEYIEFSCTFGDGMGIFISGPGITGSQNMATVPGTSLAVGVGSINPLLAGCPGPSYDMYYTDNGDGSTPGTNATVQYDGFTVPLIASASVIPCSTYHVKLVIADMWDQVYDAALFLQGESFRVAQPPFMAKVQNHPAGIANTLHEGGSPMTVSFFRTGDTSLPAMYDFSLAGSASSGDYSSLPTSISFAPGQDSTAIDISALIDGTTEGKETLKFIIQDSGCGMQFTDTLTLLLDESPPPLEVVDSRLENHTEIFPNPVKGEIFIKTQLEESLQMKYELLDLQGRIVLQKEMKLAAGSVTTAIQLKQIQSGIYFLRMKSENSEYIHKVMVAE